MVKKLEIKPRHKKAFLFRTGLISLIFLEQFACNNHASEVRNSPESDIANAAPSPLPTSSQEQSKARDKSTDGTSDMGTVTSPNNDLTEESLRQDSEYGGITDRVVSFLKGSVASRGGIKGGVEEAINLSPYTSPTQVSSDILSFHSSIATVDLHADSLLWERDITVASKIGYTDIPKLIKGGIALQVFGIVTKAPAKNKERQVSENALDSIQMLGQIERWPLLTIKSYYQRALHQAINLAKYEAKSQGQLKIIKSCQDLDKLFQLRKSSAVVGGMLGIEGAQALDGDISNLEKLKPYGLWMVSLTHEFDNEWAGSSTGLSKGGLTKRGSQLIDEAAKQGIIIDLAHVSSKAFDDIIEKVAATPPGANKAPLVISHTGLQYTCPWERNITDEQLKKLADAGGMVGIGFWQAVSCGKDMSSYVQGLKHAISIAGIEHIALGSDFDGGVVSPINSERFPELTQILLNGGLTKEQVKKIYENGLAPMRQVCAQQKIR